MTRFFLWLALLAAMTVPHAARADVTLFVPGGLTPTMEDIAKAAGQEGLTLKIVSGHSPAQARQIDDGANADIFISADPQWLDFLTQKALLVAGRQAPLVETRLILVAAKSSSLTYHAEKGESLADQLNGGKLAMGDPDMIPAGRFARDALVKLDAWTGLQGHLAFFHHVGMISAMVERGEVPAGVVFASDMSKESGLRTVAEFPVSAAPPVLFPMAIIRGHDSPETLKAYDFLLGPDAQAISKSHGFLIPKTATP